MSAEDYGFGGDAARRAFERLRREYLDEMPARFAALEAAAAAGDDGALRTMLHQLAGSGGSHGFPAISAAARQLERALAGGAPAEQRHAGVAALRLAVEQAHAELR